MPTAAPVQVQPDPTAEARRRHAQHVDALVVRVKALRSEIERMASQLTDASTELRAVCRRNFDEASSSYLVFANSHLRLAGALSQGVRRSATMDRMLVNAAREREDAREREAAFQRQQQIREHNKLVQQLQAPSADDFDDLFGEILNDAE